MTGLTAERLKELSALLDELDQIYGFFEDAEFADFEVHLGDLEIDDESDDIILPDWPVADDDADSVSPKTVAWHAIRDAYKARAAKIENKLRAAGITELPTRPKVMS